MRWIRRPDHLATFAAILLLGVACTPQLVAPYDPDLQQQASSMQAEVATWDLTMRAGAGTVADDPRNPSVSATINKWHGEAEAMLTRAVSIDPGMANCNEAIKVVGGAIERAIPDSLRGSMQPATAGSNARSGSSGCEASLVAQLDTAINDIENSLKYCRLAWVDAAYFTGLSQNPATAAKPSTAPSAAVQQKLRDSCLAEFKVTPGAPAGSAAAQHGRAVSALLATLQAIVYVETRKQAAGAMR